MGPTSESDRFHKTYSNGKVPVPREFAEEIDLLSDFKKQGIRGVKVADRILKLLDSILENPVSRNYRVFAATLLREKGNVYVLSLTGDRATNILQGIQYYEQALQTLTPDTAPYEFATTQNNKGCAYLKMPSADQSLLEKAVVCLESALEYRKFEQFPQEYAQTQNNLGTAYHDTMRGNRVSNLKRAIACYREALRAYSLETDPLAYADTCNNLGLAFCDLSQISPGEYTHEIIYWYEQALKQFTPETAPLRYARTMHNLGKAYSELRMGDRGQNYEKAIRCYREALRFRTLDDMPVEYASTQNDMGAVYADLLTGNRDENIAHAIKCYEQALKIRTPEHLPLKYAQTQHNLGNAYSAMLTGDRVATLAKAIKCYKEALKYATLQNAPFDYGLIQINLGNVYLRMPSVNRSEALQKAISHYLDALEIFTLDEYPLQYALANGNLAIAYDELTTGDRKTNLLQAADYAAAALRIYTLNTSPFEYANTQITLGSIYRNLSSLNGDLEWEKAIRCYKEALRVYTFAGSPYEYAMAQYNLGNLYSDFSLLAKDADLEKAVCCYKEALKVYRPDLAPREYANTMYNLGITYLDLSTEDTNNKISMALNCFEEALHTVDSLLLNDSIASQINAQGEWAKLYVITTECYLESHRPVAALVTAENSKSRIINQMLSREHALPSNAISQDWAEEEQRLLQKLSELDARDYVNYSHIGIPESAVAQQVSDFQSRSHIVDRLKTLWTSLDSLDDNDAREYAATRLSGNLDEARLLQFAEEMDAETALVSMFTTENQVLLFVMRQGWYEPRTLSVSISLDELIFTYFTNYSDEVLSRKKSIDTGRKFTHRWQLLGERLFRPLLPLLNNIHHIVLAPEGLLNRLPLHALTMNRSGETLSDHFVVSYVPSLLTLMHLKQRRGNHSKDNLAVGYTDAEKITSEGILERKLLLGEAQDIAEHINARLILDNNATTTTVCDAIQNRAFDLVHFSCHGDYSTDNPFDSGILLGDGVFSSREMMTLRFRANLITVSACWSGYTGDLSGNELAGLTPALLYAGASSLLLGMWAVDAMTTNAIMKAFYQNLIDKNGDYRMSGPEALRRATLDLRDGKLLSQYPNNIDTTDPYYWAPFVFVGNWDWL